MRSQRALSSGSSSIAKFSESLLAFMGASLFQQSNVHIAEWLKKNSSDFLFFLGVLGRLQQLIQNGVQRVLETPRWVRYAVEVTSCISAMQCAGDMHVLCTNLRNVLDDKSF